MAHGRQGTRPAGALPESTSYSPEDQGRSLVRKWEVKAELNATIFLKTKGRLQTLCQGLCGSEGKEATHSPGGRRS